MTHFLHLKMGKREKKLENPSLALICFYQFDDALMIQMFEALIEGQN